jgi:hypothetical protein
MAGASLSGCRCRHCGAAIPSAPRARRLRRLLEAVIEAMLTYLDELDGDADLESTADAEPSMGWSAPLATPGGAWPASADMED